MIKCANRPTSTTTTSIVTCIVWVPILTNSISCTLLYNNDLICSLILTLLEPFYLIGILKEHYLSYNLNWTTRSDELWKTCLFKAILQPSTKVRNLLKFMIFLIAQNSLYENLYSIKHRDTSENHQYNDRKWHTKRDHYIGPTMAFIPCCLLLLRHLSQVAGSNGTLIQAAVNIGANDYLKSKCL